MTGKLVDAPLFTVHNAYGVADDEARVAQRLHRVEQRAAARDDVLDDADRLARLEDALDPVRGPVVLRGLADEQERQPAGQRGGGGQRDGAELRRGQAHGVRLVLGDDLRDPLAERLQQLRPGLEAVLVEVVLGAAARAEHEVALQERVLADPVAKGGVLHARTRSSTSCASGSSRSASGEPSASESIEPSSK